MGDADQKALNALAKGAGVTAIGMLISKALTYLYRISIARFLGPEAYGQLSLALMVVGIGGTLAYLSLGSGLQKFIPEFRNRNDKASIKGIVLNALELTLPLSIIIFCIVFFGADFIANQIFDNQEIVALIQILAFTIPIAQISGVFIDTTVGHNKIIYKTITGRVIQNIVKLGVTIALLFSGFQVISAALGWLAGSIVALMFGFYFMEIKVGPILFAKVKPKSHRKEILKYSAPLLLSGMIGTAMSWADTGLLGYYMTDFEVGLYNAALPTAMLILLPHKAIGSLALSSFSELKERNSKAIEDSLQTATYWVFSLVFPTFLILLLFSEQALFILFGAKYRAASAVLSILAVGYLFDALVGRVGSLLQSKGRTKLVLYNNAAALALNLILNIILIPVYGIVGAAIATASSTILPNLLMFAEVWWKEKIISIPRKLLKVIIVGLIPLTVVMALDHLLFTKTPFWFIFPAGIIYYGLYFVVFIKVLGLEKDEKEVFRRIGEITGYEKEIEKLMEFLERKF